MKNVLITGARGSLGLACVKEYLTNHHKVIAMVSPGKSMPPDLESKVLTVPADLSDEKKAQAAIDGAIRKVKRIDVGVVTVGGFAIGNLADTDLASVKKMIDINFSTAFTVARQLFNHMAGNAEGGHLVLIGARPALDATAGKGVVAYALSKTLVFNLAELINAEGKNKGIVCSVIVPSIIDTEPNRQSMPDADFSKWVTPAEIAKTIYFATSAQKLREPVFKIYGDS